VLGNGTTVTKGVDVNGRHAATRLLCLAGLWLVWAAEAGEFSFAVIGDIQAGSFKQRLYDKSLFVAAKHPDFWIPVGDLVNESNSTQWAAYHQHMGPLEDECPTYPVVGNHDDDGTGGLSMFKAQFPGIQWVNEGKSYSFTHGDALFIMMPTYGSVNMSWLEGLLRNNTSKWVFAFQHNPFFSTGGGHATAERDKYLAISDLLEEHAVNAVFSGHTHYFETIAPLNNHRIVSSYAEGTFYYNTNGFGWAGVAAGDMPWSLKVAAVEYQALFALVTVTDGEASVVTYDCDNGSVYDLTVLPARRGSTAARRSAPLRIRSHPVRPTSDAVALDLVGRRLPTLVPTMARGVRIVAEQGIADAAGLSVVR